MKKVKKMAVGGVGGLFQNSPQTGNSPQTLQSAQKGFSETPATYSSSTLPSAPIVGTGKLPVSSVQEKPGVVSSLKNLESMLTQPASPVQEKPGVAIPIKTPRKPETKPGVFMPSSLIDPRESIPGALSNPSLKIERLKQEAARKAMVTPMQKTPIVNKGKLQTMPTQPAMKKGGSVKGYAKGGSVSSASKRADGCAVRGKTKGRIV